MKFGTREWATKNLNILRGCEHNCRYCYARWNAVKRFKTVKAGDWCHPVLDRKRLAEKPRKVKGRIMFPTQHDILPEYIDETIIYLRGWLREGNEILIVSKPHLECIKRICNDLSEFKDQIVFRFTIGSLNDWVLKFWDVDAPYFTERMLSLKHAFKHGFKTSVSIEPVLDTYVFSLVNELLPYVSDTIWIGKVNYPEQRIDTDGWDTNDYSFMDELKLTTDDDFIWELYSRYKDNPKIRWKESIKKVIGLPEEEIG